MDEPEIGDPRAKKGGTFNYYIANFPPTLRPFGPEANNSFRGEIYDHDRDGAGRPAPVDTREMYPGAGEGVGDQRGQPDRVLTGSIPRRNTTTACR